MPRRPSIDSLQASLKRLSLEEKQSILNWLTEELKAESNVEMLMPLNPSAMSTSGSVVIVEQRHYEGKTYQLEKRRCGKKGCICLDGEISEVGHGPYWYAYWREAGKLRNMYVGKRAPWDTVNRKQESP